MYWTLELASYLADAPWPATKDELIDYAIRTGAPLEVAENLQVIEDEGESYILLLKYGQTIRPKRIIFGTKKSTESCSQQKKSLLGLFLFTSKLSTSGNK